MLLAIAVLGWLLFLGMFAYYRIALRIDVRDENALSIYALCALFSGEFRAGIVDGLGQGAAKQFDESKSTEDVTVLMMKTIKHFAIKQYEPGGELSTIRLGQELVESLRQN